MADPLIEQPYRVGLVGWLDQIDAEQVENSIDQAFMQAHQLLEGLRQERRLLERMRTD